MHGVQNGVSFQSRGAFTKQANVRFGQNNNPLDNPAKLPDHSALASLPTSPDSPGSSSVVEPHTDWLTVANQLISAAGEAPPPAQVPLFTSAEAKQLISEGKIEQFNERLEYWRKYQAKPDEYFDLKGFNFGVALKNVEALQNIDSEVNGSAPLDLRGCDLRKADFRGVQTLQAAFTQDESDPDSLEKHIKSALLDSTTRFSLTTIKICT